MGSSETRPESPLRRARKEQGKPLREVAEAAGISTSYLSMIENGLHCPDRVRAALAAALELPEGELWG